MHWFSHCAEMGHEPPANEAAMPRAICVPIVLSSLVHFSPKALSFSSFTRLFLIHEFGYSQHSDQPGNSVESLIEKKYLKLLFQIVFLDLDEIKLFANSLASLGIFNRTAFS
jgi:hypothetical protein